MIRSQKIIAKWYRKILKKRKKKKPVVEEKKVVKGWVNKYIDAKGKTYDEVNGPGGRKGSKSGYGKKNSVGGRNPKVLGRNQTTTIGQSLGSTRGSKAPDTTRGSVSNMS